MDAFSHLAEHSIQTSSDGVRFLRLYGPFARAYAIASPDTEERIVRKLAGAYRLLLILLIALGAFLCRWPSARLCIICLAVIAIASWLVVHTCLHRELRRLKRIDPRARDRAESAEFVRQLEPSELKMLLRNRLFLLLMSLLAPISAVGAWNVLDAGRAGIAGAALFGLAGLKFLRLALLPPQEILTMRPISFNLWDPDDSAFGSRERSRPSIYMMGWHHYDRASEWHRCAGPRPARLETPSDRTGVWDSELDGG